MLQIKPTRSEAIKCAIKSKAGVGWSGFVHPLTGLLSAATIETEEIEYESESISSPSAKKIQDIQDLSSLALRFTEADEDAPSWVRLLSTLSKLDLSNAPSLKRLPHGIDRLPLLSELTLRGCAVLQRLPTSLLALSTSLTILNLTDCAALREVRPTRFFGVPRIWEKLLAGVHRALGEQAQHDEVGGRERSRRATSAALSGG